MFLSTSSIRSSLTTIAVLGALRQPPPLAILNNYTLTQRYRISSLIFIFLPFFVTFFSLFCLVFFCSYFFIASISSSFPGCRPTSVCRDSLSSGPPIMTGRGSPRRAREHREAPNPRMPRPKPCFLALPSSPAARFYMYLSSSFSHPLHSSSSSSLSRQPSTLRHRKLSSFRVIASPQCPGGEVCPLMTLTSVY